MERSSSILAVACVRLVFLVSRLALCSLWLSAGPRAGRYGPKAQFCNWLVLCSSRCAPVCCRQAQDAGHHGRYDSEGQLPQEHRKIGFFWEMTSYVSVSSSLVRQWIYMSVYRGLVADCSKLRSFRSCSSSLVIDILFVPQWQIFMVQTVQLIMVIPLSPLGSHVQVWRKHSCSHSSWLVENFYGRRQKVVQFLDKLFSPVVVQRHVPESVRTVCSSWTRS